MSLVFENANDFLEPEERLGCKRSKLPWGLLRVYVLSWFIPSEILLPLGQIDITPSHIVGLFLVSNLAVKGLLKFSFPDILVASCLFSVFISTSASTGLVRAIEGTGRISIEIVTVYVVGKTIGASTYNDLQRFVRFVVTILAVLAAFLPLESIVRVNVHSLAWQLPYHPHPEMRLGMTRAYGWTRHCIMLGLTYAAFLPMAVSLAIKDRFSGLSVLKMLLVGAGVFFSLSAGSWGVAAFACIFLFWDRLPWISSRLRWSIFGIGFASLILVSKLTSNNPLLMVVMYRVSFLSDGWVYRWQLWERVMKVMPGHTWIGYGELPPPEFSGLVGFSIDNHYLAIILNRGYVGLWTWLALNFWVLLRNVRAIWIRSDCSNVYFRRVVGFSIAALIIGQLSVALFSTGALMAWLLLGMGAGNLLSNRSGASANATLDPVLDEFAEDLHA